MLKNEGKPAAIKASDGSFDEDDDDIEDVEGHISSDIVVNGGDKEGGSAIGGDIELYLHHSSALQIVENDTIV